MGWELHPPPLPHLINEDFVPIAVGTKSVLVPISIVGNPYGYPLWRVFSPSLGMVRPLSEDPLLLFFFIYMNPWIKSRTTCLRDPNLLYSDQYLFGGRHMLMISNEYVKSFLLHLWLYPLCFYISSSILSNRLTHSWLENSYLYETKNIDSDTRLCLLRKTYIHTWLLDTTLQHSTEANKTTIKTHPDEGQRDTPLRLCFYYWAYRKWPSIIL